MNIHTSLALQGPDSRDWTLRPRENICTPGGRRKAIRFSMRLPVRYQAGADSGCGEIVNIGRRGALFTTDQTVALNASVELYVKWPVLLDNKIQLSLIASGTIVRTETGRAAVAIEKYEFRTCVRSFFRLSQPRQVQHSEDGAGCRLERPQYKLAEERTSRKSRRAPRAAITHEISNDSHRRKGEINDARWERVFQEKFADPEYYRFRLPSHSSPTAGA